MQAAAHIPPLWVEAAPPLPVAALAVGRPVAEVAALLPRLFNLCRAAQGAAVRLALDLPAEGPGPEQEIARDHMLKLAVTLPARLGLPTLPMDRAALIGGMPDTPRDFSRWLASGRGAAPLLARIADLFAPGEATAQLPLVTPETALSPQPLENSTAARQAEHPLMRYVAAAWGRGPMWRVLARLVDLTAPLPAPRKIAIGTAIAPAARGIYAVAASQAGGIVTAFERRTPTDHLLAPGGVMDRCLASLPTLKRGLAPLLLDILDPCCKVTLQGGADHA